MGFEIILCSGIHSLEPLKLGYSRQSTTLEPKFYVKVRDTLLDPEFHYIMLV